MPPCIIAHRVWGARWTTEPSLSLSETDFKPKMIWSFPTSIGNDSPQFQSTHFLYPSPAIGTNEGSEILFARHLQLCFCHVVIFLYFTLRLLKAGTHFWTAMSSFRMLWSNLIWTPISKLEKVLEISSQIKVEPPLQNFQCLCPERIELPLSKFWTPLSYSNRGPNFSWSLSRRSTQMGCQLWDKRNFGDRCRFCTNC